LIIAWLTGIGVAIIGTSNAGERGMTKQKFLIEYGWDCPDTAYLRAHIGEMEKRPFDGVVVSVRAHPGPGKLGGTDTLGWRVFSGERFSAEPLKAAIADLKQVRSSKLRHNFIQVISMPGLADWWTPEWEVVCYNAACLARVAKQGGCVGIMFDPEEYGHSMWTYHGWPEKLQQEHTFEEARLQARKRGQEFMQAINAEFPDITILALFGPSLVNQRLKVDPRDKVAYSLLADFYDGMMAVATPQTTLVDGFEQSYPYRTEASFREARKLILEVGKELSSFPAAFARHLRAGFGLWMDYNSGRLGWHPEDLTRNHFTPNSFQSAVHFALKHSDRYVWIYTERLNWWTGEGVTRAWEQALREAKRHPGREEAEAISPITPPIVPRAHEQRGYDDATTFAALRKTYRELLDLPKTGWLFAPDPKDVGRKERWFAPSFDASRWKPIAIGQFWDEQGVRCEGIGWYRVTFHAPVLPAGKRIFLAFGAADESAWVWLNGKAVGEHDIGEAGWDRLFLLDVTGAIYGDAENLLTVRVRNRVGPGGLWKSVKLFSE